VSNQRDTHAEISIMHGYVGRWRGDSMSERCVRSRPPSPSGPARPRGQPAHASYRPDKTPSRERRLARTERMPVVHGPEWPGPTTCPRARPLGRRRYLCSSNIKTPGTTGRPTVSARLRGDFSRHRFRRRGVSGCGGSMSGVYPSR